MSVPVICRLGHVEVTRLRALLGERHWQTYRTFRAQFLRAARALAEHDGDPSIGMLDVSERQFRRWIDGSRPRPDACRVLELLFGEPVAHLLGPIDPGTPVAVLATSTVDPDPAAVRVNVRPGTAVTVVCADSTPHRVAVIAGAIHVLIDASAPDPAGPIEASADAETADGAQVLPLMPRRRKDVEGRR